MRHRPKIAGFDQNRARCDRERSCKIGGVGIRASPAPPSPLFARESHDVESREVKDPARTRERERLKAKAIILRASGLHWAAIARILHTGTTTLFKWCRESEVVSRSGVRLQISIRPALFSALSRMAAAAGSLGVSQFVAELCEASAADYRLRTMAQSTVTRALQE